MRVFRRRVCGLWIVGVAALAALGDPAAGQTIIPDLRTIPPVPQPRPVPPPRIRPPRPPARHVYLQVKRQTVDVSIVDGVAVTSIDQLFHNPHNRPIEGTYIFPLADDVALSKFTMFIDGREVEGKLLGVEEARRTYESIVSRMRDPALLEYLGTRMFQARIFPISPKGEARVRLSYTQMLNAADGLVDYRYPLATGRHSGSPIETLSFVINIESTVPIKSVFSPSHALGVHRVSDYKVSASYEGRHVYPDKDLLLHYALSDKEFGMTVLTHRQAGSDGFFLLRIAPPAVPKSEDVLPKDISFVIDTSGSMAGEKIHQAIAALKFCLANLNEQDRFNVVPFSHEALRFRDTLVPASTENIEQACGFADNLKATGGTNINDALEAALAGEVSREKSSRPYLIVFLTDGQPTIGVIDPKEILANVKAKNAGRVRLFVFGVGHDVNTILLDTLAEQNRGTREYVEPGEDLELTLSSFYRKVADPVLADLSLTFGGLTVRDMYPTRLTDLFSGSELVVVGRYSGEGAKAVELTGTRRGRQERFVYETTFPAVGKKHEFLPRLWAARKVGFLLDEIRLHGEKQELKDTIVKLATKYGIVTPYTAYLVTEPGSVALRGSRGSTTLADAFGEAAPVWTGTAGEGTHPRKGVGRAKKHKMMPATGAGAVAASESARMLQDADAYSYSSLVPLSNTEEAGEDLGRSLVEHVGTRTFYRLGDRWIDAAHDSDRETRKVEAFSKEYFDLIRKHPSLAKCFALGERVVVVIDGTSYETVPPGSTITP